jgi:hypothetical protein
MGFRDIERIALTIGDMEGALEPIPYIVLRHKDFSKTDGDQLFGLYGIRVRKGTGLGGGIATEVYVDENTPCTFYHDRNNVQFAVIPDCKQNRAVLTNPNNVRQLLMVQRGERAPVLTIIQAPEDLKALIDKTKKDITEKKIDPTPKYEQLSKVEDAFNCVKLDSRMPVEGETKKQ